MSDEKEVKLHTTDKALLDAVTKNTGEGCIELTPDLFKSIMNDLDERIKEINEIYPKLVAGCPTEVRLAVTAQVFKAIVDHAIEGGTFRYLIYDRLGFGPEAYVPLYEAGGMTISNEFDLSVADMKRSDWLPIDIAPKDRLILVYCPPVHGLEELISVCKWHQDAGFCVDELRQPTHWCEIPKLPKWVVDQQHSK